MVRLVLYNLLTKIGYEIYVTRITYIGSLFMKNKMTFSLSIDNKIQGLINDIGLFSIKGLDIFKKKE